MLSRRTRVVAGTIGLVAIGLSVGRGGSAANSFSFALIGDVPYSSAAVTNMPALIADVNNDTGVEFVAHVGDIINNTTTACDNSTLTSRFNLFQTFEDAFWFTPGDNDWTDCWKGAPPPYDPQERLVWLRDRFYPVPDRTTGGNPMTVIPQSASSGYGLYVENVRFKRDCVTFGSIHQVGSKNGLDPVTGESTAEKNARVAEVNARIAADVAWIDTVFNRAIADNSKGVFLIIHDQPTTGAGTVAVRDKLQARAQAYGKPVILANGSEHVFEAENNYLGVSNMKRWQVTGGPGAGTTDTWLKIGVDCGSAAVFSYTTVATGTTPTTTTTTPPPTTTLPPGPGIDGPARVTKQAQRQP